MRKKVETELVSCEGLHQRNILATNLLFPDTENKDKDYKNLPLLTFKPITIPLLKVLIHVQIFETATVPKG